MIIATLPDVHLMERSPKNRTDKLGKTSLLKLEWCLASAIKEHADILAIPGDLFDTALSSNAFIGQVGNLFLRHDIDIVAVPGQHDLRYHTRGLANTPMGVLEAHGIINVVTIEEHMPMPPYRIYGCGWGDDDKLRELVDNNDVSNHILLIHRMITKSKELYPGQEDWIGAKAFLKRYPFKLVLSGDNHNRHITEVNGKTLINAGSMMRLERSQIDYQPQLYFHDLKTGKTWYRDIPCEPFDEVFDLDSIEDDIKKEERREKVDDLVDAIKIDRKRINFPEVLNLVTKEAKPSNSVREILDDIMEEANA